MDAMTTDDAPPATKTKAPRGFAALSKEQRTEIARRGGRSVAPERRTFSQDRTLAVEAGRRGGKAKPSDKDGAAED